MPFNSMVLTCLTTGKHVGESGRRVSLASKRGMDEVALFFSVDETSNSGCSLRKHLGITGPICDGVVYYYAPERKVICFVELKGKNLEGAVKQVVNTLNKFKRGLGRELQGGIDWKACILYGGAAHSRISKNCQAKLRSAFGRKGRGFVTTSAPKLDIGALLRS